MNIEGRMLLESEGYELLQGYGIPVPDHHVVATEAKAARAAERIGYPVVLKIVSRQIIHKSDVGGVVPGILDETMLYEEYRSLMVRVKESSPKAVIEGVIIEKEMPKGLELLIGGKTDPSFGKVITFGMGGTLVELVRDVAIRVLPVNNLELRRMVSSIKGYPLIRGFRGGEPLDETALLRILQNVCDMFWNRPDLREFDINPLILYKEEACAVDARIIVDEGGKQDEALKSSKKYRTDPEIFSPKTIALVGASSNPNKIGYAMLRNLLSFDGTVYPVNPNAKEILGKKVYPSLLDIPGPVEMILVAVPAPAVPKVIEDAGRKRARVAVIISAGFRETGEEGRMLEEQVLEIARHYGVRIIGPNCLGIMLPHRGLNATFDPTSPRPGPIAFISQSGAVITTSVDWSLAEEIGISAVISVGNQSDLEFEDYMAFAENDPNTKAIILYVEEIKNGKQFLEFSQRVSGKKPIIALKSGSSKRGQMAASSHTGSLAGSYEIYQAAFRQAGVISVHSIREAFGVAELLASEGYPKGPRALIITSAGGFAVLSSDYAEKYGIELVEFSNEIMGELNTFLPAAWSHENPLDMVGDAGVDRFARVFDVMIHHQDEWDVAFVISVPSVTLDPTHLAKEIIRFSMYTHKMVVGCLLGGESTKAGIRTLRTAHVPNFSELEDAFRAVGIALERGNLNN
jgi:acetyl coenzyme A synthetase (ADP forming)-like protein